MHARYRRGFTLAEMLIACAVLAIAAAVALPSSSPVAQYGVDAATAEVAQALHFAREEAQRSGAYRMMSCDTGQNQIAVYLPDTNGGVAASLNDPLTQMNYPIVLGQLPGASGAALTGCSFVFADKSTATTVAFDANGNPVRGTGGATTASQALTSGTVQISAGGYTRTVTLDVNGRITTS